MFRKPKRKPSALRGKPSVPNNAVDGASDGDIGAHHSSGGTNDASSASRSSAGKKRRRARAHQNSSSSSEEDNNDEEGTSGLLQQLRQERDDAKSKKSSSANPLLLNTSSTTTSTKKKSKDTTNWMHQYKSNDSQMTAQENATRTAEYHPANQDKASADADGDGDYNNSQKNASSQNAQIAALQKQPRNKFLAGPLRATTFVRTTVRFDYQPDICKDYKETGFCGFGDTCIYLHDRGDTKSGWQMEAEYEEKKKKEEEKKSREMEIFMNSMMCGEVKGSGTMTSSQSSSSIGNAERNAVMAEDGIPFACHTCRGPFQNPIVTTCGHYFCEKCMMTRIREVGSGCPICQKDTHGVMNHPQKLVAKKRRLVGRDGTWEEYLERSKGSGDGDDAA